MEEKLLPELISYIHVQGDVEYKARELSKSIKQYADYELYTKKCNDKILEFEFEKYTDTGNTFGFVINNFTLEQIEMNGAIYQHSTLDIDEDEDIAVLNYSNSFLLRHSKIYNNDDDIEVITRFIDEPLLIDYNIISHFDLVTYFYCYKNRFNCMNINKEYAKNKTLELFDYIINLYKDEFLFIYLYINYRVMNLPYYGPYPNFYIETNIDNIDIDMSIEFEPLYKYIPEMINNIKKYIELLHQIN
jgi:hypothetical protein